MVWNVAGRVPLRCAALLAGALVVSAAGGPPGAASLVSPQGADNGARLIERMGAKLAYPQTPLEYYHRRERVTQQERDWRGRVKPTTVELYDVMPNLHDPEGYRRLLEQDGRPLPPAEANRLEARQRFKVQQAFERRANETPAERAARLASEARKREKEQKAVEDVFRAYAFEVGERTVLAGRRTVLVTFTPRPDAKPATDIGKLAPKVAGRLWLDEEEAEVARVEARSIRTITYGFGILVRIRPGATLVYTRVRTASGEWLPASYRVVADVRLLLVKPLSVDRFVEFFDFEPLALPATGF